MGLSDDARELIRSGGGEEPGESPVGAGVPCATAARERFAQALAVHDNQTAAYREAYPNASPATAAKHAYKLANKPDVQRRVKELRDARRKQLLEETADLEALVANLCLGKPARLVNPETGSPIPLSELPVDVQHALKGVKVRVTTSREGDVTHEYDVTFPDPLQALKLLAQLRGALVERDLTSAGRALAPAVDPRDLPALDAELRKRLLPDVPPPEPEPLPDDYADLLG